VATNRENYMRKGNHGDKCAAQQVVERAEGVRAKIAEAAYYRAKRRGFVGGDPVEDWLAAERELCGQPPKDTEETQAADSPIVTFNRR